jgi:hypothetical protein
LVAPGNVRVELNTSRRQAAKDEEQRHKL